MIRKQNSEFNTAFVSEAVGSIKNTDSFAYVELDGLACYVLADGIDEKYGADAARLCVDSVISAFNESPSMSKRSLKKYAKVANEALQKHSERSRLKASAIILIHNYTKMRYLLAGNVRLRLYRDGFLKYESKDQSLGMELVSSEKIPKDKLIVHEERHNLQSYIGQEHNFSPFISRKLKLYNTDSIAIFSRGYWEGIDDGELLDLFKDAGTDPKETVNTAEDMLITKYSAGINDKDDLSIQYSDKLQSYSFITIFVNKIFINPNIKRNIKKAIMTIIPIILVIITISIVLYFMHKNKQEKIELMEDSYLQTIEYILADNYIKAEAKAKETINLAEEVKDKKMKKSIVNYLMLIESIVSADEKLSSESYEDAQECFLNALDRSRYADNMAKDYIEDRIELTAKYISVYDLIVLGDTQVLNLQYDEAEQKYLDAKILSAEIYFDKGRQNAMIALEELYALKKEISEKEQEQASSVVELETAAASFIAQGDTAFLSEDYEGALVFYTSAQQKYDELKDIINSEMVQKKIDSTKTKLGNIGNKRDEAVAYIKLAEQETEDENYVDAKKHYILAKDIYARLKSDDKVAELETRINILDLEDEKNRLAKELEEKAKMEKAESEEKNSSDIKVDINLESELESEAKSEEKSGEVADPIIGEQNDR